MSELNDTAGGGGATGVAFLRKGTPRLLSSSLLALFLAALDQTIVGPVLADIMRDFGGGALLAWVATGYLMAAMVSAPLYGAIADIRGRRFALLLANGLFFAGALLAGLAANLPWLVGARIIQGAGAGGLVSIPFVIVADRVPMSKRALYSAIISTIYSVAGLLGPMAGGSLAEFLSWRAVFWINILPCIAVFWGVSTALAPRAPLSGRRIDWPGAGLLLMATVPLLLVFSGAETPAEEGGSLLPAIPLLAISAVFWAAFGWRMLRAADPLIPLSVLTNRSILLASLALAAMGGANIGLTVYLPLYFQQVFGLSSAQAGTCLLSLVVGGMFAGYIPPQILRINPSYKPLTVVCACFCVMSCAALAWVMAGGLSGEPSLASVLWPSVILGICFGLLYPVYPLIVQNAAAEGQMGASIGVLSFMRSMGGTLCVSIIGMTAIGSGLATEGGAARLPVWSLAGSATGILLICLLSLILLPKGRLEGFGGRG